MRRLALAIMGALALAGTAVPVAAEMPATDTLSKFFLWWNATYKVPGGYTADAFRRYFTEDATLVLEGRTVIRGVDQWASHFQKIQAGGGEVEIVVPFKMVFQAGDQIYNYHVSRARRDGKVNWSRAAGHADLKGGKISSIVLVRADLDPAKGPMDPQCWTK